MIQALLNGAGNRLWSAKRVLLLPVSNAAISKYQLTPAEEKHTGTAVRIKPPLSDPPFAADYATPQLMRSVCPFTQSPLGPSRNETALTMSSGVPILYRGDILEKRSIGSSLFPSSKSSVKVGPEAKVLTIIILPRNSESFDHGFDDSFRCDVCGVLLNASIFLFYV